MNSCLIGVTLYDWSGIPLDRRALQTLYQSNQRLGSILAIIKALISQSAPTTEEGRLLQEQSKSYDLTKHSSVDFLNLVYVHVQSKLF